MVRILVVDDLNIMRQGVRAILKDNPDLTVIGTANDGQSAIEKASVLQPDILIMDIEMPKMNGIVATRKICERFPKIKVLILSSYENRENIVLALQAGAYGYLLKNTLAKNLEWAIWSVYHGHSQIEPRLLKKVLTGVSPTLPKESLKQNASNSIEKRPVQKIASNLNGRVDAAVEFKRLQPKNSHKSPLNPKKTTLKQIQERGKSTPNSHKRNIEDKKRLSIFSQFKKPRSIALGMFGILVAGTTIFYSLNFINRPAETPIVEETVETVTATGKIEPAEEIITLSPPPDLEGTTIAELMVAEGERVKEGQIIALLEAPTAKKAAVETAKREVEVARVNLEIAKSGAIDGNVEAKKAEIESLKAELTQKTESQKTNLNRLEARLQKETEAQDANLERSQLELENATSQFQRYQKLAENGAISKSELNDRRLSLETARKKVAEVSASYDSVRDNSKEEIEKAQDAAKETKNAIARQIQEAEANLADIAKVRPLNVQKATVELEKAVSNLQQAEQNSASIQVKAPVTSQVLKIDARPGEAIAPNEEIVELGQSDRMVVVAEIDESDLDLVGLGQQAQVTGKGNTFDGEVRGEVIHVKSQIRESSVSDIGADNKVVEIKIMLDSVGSQKVSQFANSEVAVKIDRD